MAKTIVLGLDGSEGADRAIPVAADLAKRDGASIVISHVVERIAAKGGMAPIHPDEDTIKEEVEKRAGELREQGIPTEVEYGTVVLGGPARVIADLADRVHADLVVVGTRGRSPVAGALLGSVTQKLLHLVSCPVLCVPTVAPEG